MDVFIVNAKRTPIGAFMGSLSKIPAAELAAATICEVLRNVDHERLGEVIVGHVLPAGQGMGVARQAALKAGLAQQIPAYTVNMVCGSGLKAVMIGESELRAQRFDLVVAAGTENMSQAPFALPGGVRSGAKLGHLQLQDLLLKDGLTDAFHNCHMGITAENVVRKYSISREQQDAFAYQSIQKSIQSVDAGVFDEEIVAVEVKESRKMRRFARDEHPNRASTLEKLGQLRPVFEKEGSVTAGNSSGINDGASAVLLASEAQLRRGNLQPMARIVASCAVGLEPALMGLGPALAVEKVLALAGLQCRDVEAFELNEAFAGQALGVLQELSSRLGFPVEELAARVNVNGGAIGLGHPLGCSGNRILVTLLHELRRRQGRYGIASLCIGGGMGCAMLVENVASRRG